MYKARVSAGFLLPQETWKISSKKHGYMKVLSWTIQILKKKLMATTQKVTQIRKKIS